MGGGTGGNNGSTNVPTPLVGFGGNTLGHHQTMFFGPAHTLTQYSSLPRRSAGSAFQRNTPIRRSTGIPEHHMEYFVPRSISEFNLSGVGDLALPPPRRYSPTIQHGGMGGMTGMTGMPGMGGNGLPHGLQLGPPQTLICTGQPPPPQQMQIMMKPREKMVTFEDESKAMNVTASTGVSTSNASTATHCPHGVPTTPRKVGGIIGGSSGVGAGDVFM
uniref:Uncharacterized protein n=2 Tax=Ceratitis capitata TaxID=7213 RepID=W8CED0_CERCA